MGLLCGAAADVPHGIDTRTAIPKTSRQAVWTLWYCDPQMQVLRIKAMGIDRCAKMDRFGYSPRKAEGIQAGARLQTGDMVKAIVYPVKSMLAGGRAIQRRTASIGEQDNFSADGYEYSTEVNA